MNSISELFFGPRLQPPVPAAPGAATSAGADPSPFAVSLGDARAAQPASATPAAPGATPTQPGAADRDDSDPRAEPLHLDAPAMLPPEGLPVTEDQALHAWPSVPASQPGDVEAAPTPRQTGNRLPQAPTADGKPLPLSVSGAMAVEPVAPPGPGSTTGADGTPRSSPGMARHGTPAAGAATTPQTLPVEALRGPGHPILGDRVAAGADTPLPASAQGTSLPTGGAAQSGAAKAPVTPLAPGALETRRSGAASAAPAAGSAAALLERFGPGLAEGPAGAGRGVAPSGVAVQPLPVPAVGDPRPDALPTGDAVAVAATLDRRALLEAAGRQRASRNANGATPETADRSAGPTVESGEQRTNTLTQRPVLPLLAPRDLSALAERIEMLAHRRLSSASVNLKLGDLGDVEISVRMESRQAHVQFVVQDAAVREALESQLPRLRTLLAEGGLDLGDVAANLQGRGEDSGAQRESAPSAGHESRIAGSDTRADQPTQFRRRQDGDRLLDAFA